MSQTKKATAFRSLDWIVFSSLILLLGALFFSALSEIALICWNNEDYSHGLLLPLIILYIWWDQKAEISQRLRERRLNENGEFGLFLPLVLLLLGLMLMLLGLSSKLSYFSWIAFFPTTIALVWLIFGKTVFIIFSGPFLLLLMSKPLPDSVVVRIFWPLQVFAAKVGAQTLELLKVPVHLSGNVIEIPGMKLLVEEACSGMRSVMALLTLAFMMIFLMPLNFFGKVLLVVSSLVLALILNIFRVALTGVLAHFYDPAAATGFFHTFSGLIVFVVGLPVIFYTSSLLSKLSFTRKLY